MLPLSKTLDPQDFDQLAVELRIVDRHFASEREQHPMRRWEYALALRALATWTLVPRFVIDVGGAGSPFYRMVPNRVPSVLDPDCAGGCSLANYLTTRHPSPQIADAVFCLSVLEHVDDLDQFCYHLSCLVAPGGLLFLTMDYCDGVSRAADNFRVPDPYHFNWMRKRIFNSFALGQIVPPFRARDFDLLGGADYYWHGPQVYDYTFASLALVKRA